MFHKFYHKIFHVFSASESILHLRVNETLSLSYNSSFPSLILFIGWNARLSLLQFHTLFIHSFHSLSFILFLSNFHVKLM